MKIIIGFGIVAMLIILGWFGVAGDRVMGHFFPTAQELTAIELAKSEIEKQRAAAEAEKARAAEAAALAAKNQVEVERERGAAEQARARSWTAQASFVGERTKLAMVQFGLVALAVIAGIIGLVAVFAIWSAGQSRKLERVRLIQELEDKYRVCLPEVDINPHNQLGRAILGTGRGRWICVQ